MARARRVTSRARREATQAKVEATKTVDHGADMVRDLKLLDIKRSVIHSTERRLPWLYAGMVPMGLVCLFFALMGLFGIVLAFMLGGTYMGTIFGPLGVLERRSSARAESNDLLASISRRLPLLSADNQFALFGYIKGNKKKIVLTPSAIGLNNSALNALTPKGDFVDLGKYKYLGVARVNAAGRLDAELTEFGDLYWISECRRAGCSDSQMEDAVSALPLS